MGRDVVVTAFFFLTFWDFFDCLDVARKEFFYETIFGYFGRYLS